MEKTFIFSLYNDDHFILDVALYLESRLLGPKFTLDLKWNSYFKDCYQCLNIFDSLHCFRKYLTSDSIYNYMREIMQNKKKKMEYFSHVWIGTAIHTYQT